MTNNLVHGTRTNESTEAWLIRWLEGGDEEPWKFWTSLGAFVGITRRHSRFEQDYAKMQRKVGRDHFERRSWQGFHHHVRTIMYDAWQLNVLALERILS